MLPYPISLQRFFWVPNPEFPPKKQKGNQKAKAPDAVTLGASLAACDRGQQWQLALALLQELPVSLGPRILVHPVGFRGLELCLQASCCAVSCVAAVHSARRYTVRFPVLLRVIPSHACGVFSRSVSCHALAGCNMVALYVML